jgi:L-alanine-DL-glutamate epimerase-like enolase superfamily enzyme
VRDAAAYPILKVKLGSPEGLGRDEALIRTVREEAPEALLRVDANAAWTPKAALAMAGLLADLGVEFLEQPLPPHDLEGLRFVRERSPLPVIADESCVMAHDVPRLAGVVDGVNLKLAKCGGLREAHRSWPRRARTGCS